MLNLVEDLSCQLFHSRWAEVVSYSRQGAWRCAKPGCAAQARHDTSTVRSSQAARLTRLPGKVTVPGDASGSRHAA